MHPAEAGPTREAAHNGGRMRVFVTWSGELSHDVAILLKDRLPRVLQVLGPYVSSEDIAKGARWFTEIPGELEASRFGMICVTRDNAREPWVNCEAGALSRQVQRKRVCPFSWISSQRI